MWGAAVFCLSFLLSLSSGSKILFSATPDVLQTNLTQSMTMRCSLNDTDIAPSVGSVVGKRDVTQTSENMQTLTSIVITRNNGDHVATLIQGQPAKAIRDLANMQVTGQLGGAGDPGEQGYLELSWINPSTDQTGEYVCEVNTISSLGHNVILSNTLEVGESVPTIGELLGLIKNLENNKNLMQQQLDNLSQNLSVIQQQTTTAPPVTTSGVVNTPQVLSGRVECGDSSGWGRDNVDDWATSQTVHTNFKTPFSKTPFVHISVNSIDHEEGENIRYDVKAINVGRYGFEVKCKTWAGSHMYHVYVDWMAVSG